MKPTHTITDTRRTAIKPDESIRINLAERAIINPCRSWVAALRCSLGLIGLALVLCPGLSAHASTLPFELRQERPSTLPTTTDSLQNGLGWHAWTNFLEKSYGCDDSLYITRTYSGDGPPTLAWSTNGLLRKFTNYTALSQVNSFCGSAGQVPVTLLSRRHGYMRGHGTIHDGDGWKIKTDYAGKKVWFCDENNNLVTATIKASFGGTGTVTGSTNSADFVVLLFDADVPSTIANIQVCLAEFYFEEVLKKSRDNCDLDPRPLHRATMVTTSQLNRVGVYPWSTRAGFQQDCYIGGDSGAPQMLPVRDALVMFGGATTSGLGAKVYRGARYSPYAKPEPEFHADTFVEYAIETLNAWEGIDSRDLAYNLEYADLSAFGLTNGCTGNLTPSGVPVLWLERYGLSTDGSADYLDFDSDGIPNWQEWRAGTDPADPLSVLKLLAPVYSPAGVLLRWNSQTNVTYRIERADNLSAPIAWTVVRTNVPGKAVETTFIDTRMAPGGSAFYRVGTASTNLEAPIRLQSPEIVAATVTLRWNSVAEKTYVIERAPSPTGPFSILQSNIVGQAGVTSFVDRKDVGAGPFFYRVGVQ
jgi:hypothetical protein